MPEPPCPASVLGPRQPSLLEDGALAQVSWYFGKEGGDGSARARGSPIPASDHPEGFILKSGSFLFALRALCLWGLNPPSAAPRAGNSWCQTGTAGSLPAGPGFEGRCWESRSPGCCFGCVGPLAFRASQMFVFSFQP